MGENIVALVAIIPVVMIFGVIGIYSYKNNIPMSFWKGSIVEAKEITDIKAYNKAVGELWIRYGLAYLIAWITSVFSKKIGNILMLLVALIGSIVLIFSYSRIYNKYKTGLKKEKTKQEKKHMWIVSILVALPVLLLCLILATVDINGSHQLNIKDKKAYIEMTSFTNEGVESVELLDDVEIGERGVGTNTTFASRGAYYVNGKESIVYVYKNKKPYIKVSLKNGKDIYYNEKDSEGTKKTYNKLLEFIK